MAKLTTSDLASVTPPVAAATAINANFALVEAAMEKTLSRDGTTPNQMEATLDMNSNRIINLPAPVADQEPLRKVDLINYLIASDDFISVADFGCYPGEDITANLQAAADAGHPLVFPEGTYTLSSTIVCTNEQNWEAIGTVVLQYNVAVGAPATPMLDFRGRINMLGNFIIDHRADVLAMAQPTVYGGNLIAGSAILVQGDASLIDGIHVRNAWGNGIALVKMNTTTGAEVPGYPICPKVVNVHGYSNGVGDRTTPDPGRNGATVDVASATGALVDNCTDFGSYAGFIIDIGAGAQCSMTNCIAWYTKIDPAYPFPTGGSGFGFYVGSSQCTVTNCISMFSEFRGFWIDGTATNCEITGCLAYLSAKEGWFIKGGYNTFVQCRAKGCGALASNTYDAFLIDTSAYEAVDLEFIGCSTTGAITGTTHRYGMGFSGANPAYPRIIGGNWEGLTGEFGTPAAGRPSLLLFGPTGYLGNAVDPLMPVELTGTTVDYTTSVVGDFTSNGVLAVTDKANRLNRLAMGYDPTNNVGIVQSVTSGTSVRPTLINPSGGSVGLGRSTGATTADTTGYALISKVDGAPTGVPADVPSGMVAMRYDSTNNRLYIYDGGWISVLLA